MNAAEARAAALADGAELVGEAGPYLLLRNPATPRTGERLVAVLSHAQHYPNLRDYAFPVPAVSVVDTSDQYYLREPRSLAAALIAQAKSIGARRILLMGSSRGGFGSLLIGSLIARDWPEGEVAATAFGPQVRLWPPNSRLDFPTYLRLVKDAGTDPTLRAALEEFGDATDFVASSPRLKATLVYGALNFHDAAEARLLRGIPHVRHVRVYLSSHNVMVPFVFDASDRRGLTAGFFRFEPRNEKDEARFARDRRHRISQYCGLAPCGYHHLRLMIDHTTELPRVRMPMVSAAFWWAFGGAWGRLPRPIFRLLHGFARAARG